MPAAPPAAYPLHIEQGGSRRLAAYLESHGDGSPPPLGSAGADVASRSLAETKLLELGAGTGALGLAACRLGAEVTAVVEGKYGPSSTTFIEPKSQVPIPPKRA